ncbi:hypothetical protein JCM6882_002600 [Rhodosporidiobolus microsporus]
MASPLVITFDCNRAYQHFSSLVRPFDSGTWAVSALTTGASAAVSWENCHSSVTLLRPSTVVLCDTQGAVVGRAQLAAGAFPSSPRGSLSVAWIGGEDGRRPQVGAFRFELEVDRTEEVQRRRIAALFDVPTTVFNICLRFPCGRRLFADPALLQQSDYWRRCLWFPTAFSSGTREYDPDIYMDSHTEIDPPAPAEDPLPPDVRTFSINDFAYSTYRAYLCHLYGSSPSFIPLGTTKTHPPPRVVFSETTRRLLLSHFTHVYPGIPLPVSPSSLYRLARKLDDNALCERCVDEIKTQFTSEDRADDLVHELLDVQSLRHEWYAALLVELFKADPERHVLRHGGECYRRAFQERFLAPRIGGVLYNLLRGTAEELRSARGELRDTQRELERVRTALRRAQAEEAAGGEEGEADEKRARRTPDS